MNWKCWIGIFLVGIGCSQPVQEEAEAYMLPDPVGFSLGQRALVAQALAFPLPILFPGTYHGDEVPARAYQRAWLGLFQEGDRFELVPTKLLQRQVEDPLLDAPGMQTGWEIQAERPGTCLFLVSPSTGVRPGEVQYWIHPNSSLLPGDSLRFSFHEQEYLWYATGNREAMLRAEPMSLDYSFWWCVVSNEGKRCTPLWHIESMDDQSPSLLFVGDLDRDGFLDVVVNEAAHYNVFAPALWLSGGVSGPEALRKLGGMTAVGC